MNVEATAAHKNVVRLRDSLRKTAREIGRGDSDMTGFQNGQTPTETVGARRGGCTICNNRGV